MSRSNQAIPKWDSNKKRWRYSPYIDGRQLDFYSKKAGPKGAAECKRKAQLARAGREDIRSLRVATVYDRYLDYLETRHPDGRNSNAWRDAEIFGRLYILPAVKNCRISDLTGMDWQALVDEAKPASRHRTQTENRELSAKTLQHLRSVIVGLCRFAIKLGANINLPELTIPIGREKVKKNILSMEQAVELLSLPYDADIYINAYKYALLTGRRPGEVLGLQEADIDGDYTVITRAINDRGQITRGKNANARRFEFLHDHLKLVIADQRKLKRALGIMSPWLFPRLDGTMPTQEQYRDHLAALCKARDWPHLTPYRLRHNLVSVMDGRVDLTKIKTVLGHSASMDTLGTYRQALADSARIAGAAIADAWTEIIEARK